MRLIIQYAVLLFALSETCAAHIGGDLEREVRERREFLLEHRSTLTHCNEIIHTSGLHRRALARRSGLLGHIEGEARMSNPAYSEEGIWLDTNSAR